MPAPASTAYGVRLRAAADDARSSTSTPAPSPSTNPSRVLSKGPDARSGPSFEPGVGPRLAGGDDRRLLAAVEPARLHAGQHLGRVDRHAGRDAHRQVGRPRVLEGDDAGAPVEQPVPEGVDVATERGGGP